MPQSLQQDGIAAEGLRLPGRLTGRIAEGGRIGIGVGQGGRGAHIPDLDLAPQAARGSGRDDGIGPHLSEGGRQGARRRHQTDAAAHQDQLAVLLAGKLQPPGLGTAEQCDGVGAFALGQSIQEGSDLLVHGAGDKGDDRAGEVCSAHDRVHDEEPTLNGGSRSP